MSLSYQEKICTSVEEVNKVRFKGKSMHLAPIWSCWLAAMLVAGFPHQSMAESHEDSQMQVPTTANASIVLSPQKASSDVALVPVMTGERVRIGISVRNEMNLDTRFTYNNPCPCIQPNVPFLDILAGTSTSSYVDFVVPYSSGPFAETIRGTWNGPDEKPRTYTVKVSGVTYDLLAPSDGSGIEDLGAESSRLLILDDTIGQFEIKRDALSPSWDSVQATLANELFSVQTVAKPNEPGAWLVTIHAREGLSGTLLVGHFVFPIRFYFSKGGAIMERHVDRTATIYFRNKTLLPMSFVDLGDLGKGNQRDKSLNVGEGVHLEHVELEPPNFADIHIEPKAQSVAMTIYGDDAKWAILSGLKSGDIVMSGTVGENKVLMRVPVIWRCKSSH